MSVCRVSHYNDAQRERLGAVTAFRDPLARAAAE